MAIRPFDWRDLPVLIRYRNQGMFFDTALVLTRGPLLVPAGAILSYFAPATGIFTYLYPDDGNSYGPLMGQVMHSSNATFARLSFLAPQEALESANVPALLEHLIKKIGNRGALHLLAEVDERSIAYEVLRRSSFAIYARQRVWKVDGDTPDDHEMEHWRDGRSRDIMTVRSLYNNLVPGLVQQVEPPPNSHLHGIVYQQKDELLAYVEIKYGLRGIWIQPYIHPDAEELASQLGGLIANLPFRRSRPVYICVRSYQSWLEPAIEDLGATPGPRQAVMVKHLAIAKRLVRSFALKRLEGGHPEITAPIAHSENAPSKLVQSAIGQSQIGRPQVARSRNAYFER